MRERGYKVEVSDLGHSRPIPTAVALARWSYSSVSASPLSTLLPTVRRRSDHQKPNHDWRKLDATSLAQSKSNAHRYQPDRSSRLSLIGLSQQYFAWQVRNSNERQSINLIIYCGSPHLTLLSSRQTWPRKSRSSDKRKEQLLILPLGFAVSPFGRILHRTVCKSRMTPASLLTHT